ncbi:hypothetical protein V8F06_008452 [Rhypophila decipiens]
MGFMSHRRRHVEVHPEQKWDYISLNDFKSTSCFTPFAYAFLWFSLFLSIAVYTVDIFTAVQLLVFNNWASSIELTQIIPFDVSKYVFSVCIILSVVNLAFEHIRARKIMSRGSVAECFLDSLAARLESIRMGRGRGWRRFLVFAELTKSKKGSEYVALFTYFSFQSWIRVLLCSGPRQVINAFTIYSVYNAQLSVNGESFESGFLNFFDKLRQLAEQDSRQVVVLSGMAFTLVIWVFSFLSLLIAAVLFVFYLWHIIPRDDGGLTGFCERKINKRLKQIVSIKINKAMAEDERKRRKAEMKAAKKNGEDRPMTMQPTLPSLPPGFGDDKLPEMPSLKRQETMASVTLDSSRPSTPGSFEMNSLGRPMPSRTGTMMSSTSYSSKVSLLGAAAEPGRSASPAPTLPNLDRNNYTNSRQPTLPFTGANNTPLPPSRTATIYGQGPQLERMDTSATNRSYGPGPQLQRMESNGSSLRAGYTASPAPTESMPPFPPPVRSVTGGTVGSRGPGPYPGSSNSRPGFPFDEYSSGRASPAPSTNTYRNGPLSPRGPDGYPMRSATNPMPPRGPQPYPPQRNMTAPVQPRHEQSDSFGSQRTMGGPFQPQHRPTGSNGSARNMRSPPPGQAQYPGQPTYGFSQSQDYEDRGYDYNMGSNMGNSINRPMTSNSQRTAPGPSRPGYGNGGGYDGGGYGDGGSGWDQDVEQNGGRRY